MKAPQTLMTAAACLVTLAAADAAGAAPSAEQLQACAAIATDAERLACFDGLYHRGAVPAPSAAAPRSAAPAPPAAAPPAAAPLAAPTAATPAAAAAAAPPPAAPSKETFGLYSVEHPTIPLTIDSISARVIAFGRHSDGHPTVALEGGQLWKLDESDPVLAVGDMVTIKRAALGSFLLTTASKRTHRVTRLR